MSINGICYEILFLDASDDVLVKRYKETRRTHPLAGLGRVDEGIRKERKALEFLKKDADYILDTSQLLTRELKAELDKIFVQDQKFKNLMITVLSFGFKYGIPADSDLVFDVRFLPNPYYVEGMRPLSGNDAPVRDYVMGFETAQVFAEKIRGYDPFSDSELYFRGQASAHYQHRLHRRKTPFRNPCQRAVPASFQREGLWNPD